MTGVATTSHQLPAPRPADTTRASGKRSTLTPKVDQNPPPLCEGAVVKGELTNAPSDKSTHDAAGLRSCRHGTI